MLFSVKDTGIGIPEDKMDRLFKSFSQVDGSTTRKYGGTGLGLSICKKLVELMNGQVGVHSRESIGSNFWFTAVFEKQDDAHKKTPVVPQKIKDKRVLIVDDNDTNQFVLQEQLKSWGCKIERAYNGARALEYLYKAAGDNKPFDIALVDMQMPKMSGETLGKTIKRDPLLKNTTLVMMTSIGTRGDARRMQEIGFAAYLTKPVKMSKLYDCLTTVVGKGQDRASGSQAPIVTKYTLAESKKTEHTYSSGRGQPDQPESSCQPIEKNRI